MTGSPSSTKFHEGRFRARDFPFLHDLTTATFTHPPVDCCPPPTAGASSHDCTRDDPSSKCFTFCSSLSDDKFSALAPIHDPCIGTRYHRVYTYYTCNSMRIGTLFFFEAPFPVSLSSNPTLLPDLNYLRASHQPLHLGGGMIWHTLAIIRRSIFLIKKVGSMGRTVKAGYQRQNTKFPGTSQLGERPRGLIDSKLVSAKCDRPLFVSAGIGTDPPPPPLLIKARADRANTSLQRTPPRSYVMHPGRSIGMWVGFPASFRATEHTLIKGLIMCILVVRRFREYSPLGLPAQCSVISSLLANVVGKKRSAFSFGSRHIVPGVRGVLVILRTSVVVGTDSQLETIVDV